LAPFFFDSSISQVVQPTVSFRGFAATVAGAGARIGWWNGEMILWSAMVDYNNNNNNNNTKTEERLLV
jgi:hypothetical protein